MQNLNSYPEMRRRCLDEISTALFVKNGKKGETARPAKHPIHDNGAFGICPHKDKNTAKIKTVAAQNTNGSINHIFGAHICDLDWRCLIREAHKQALDNAVHGSRKVGARRFTRKIHVIVVPKNDDDSALITNALFCVCL